MLMEPDEIRNKYSQKEREAMPLEDFAGPNRTFPIADQDDVFSAARLYGHAEHPDQVKQNIINIAKRKGFKLPDGWQDEDNTRSAVVDFKNIYMPIVRFDEANWTVTGQATVEDVDTYGTIFDYEASKRAFQNWSRNVREMHDSKKAVGKAIDVEFDDANKRILVTTKISRGAKDTWEKVLDGTLIGYSVGAQASQESWGEIERNGKKYPLLKDYSLVELSLVDNPATPNCYFDVVRAQGADQEGPVATDILAVEETATPTDAREGKRVSSDMQDKLHASRDAAMNSAMSIMGACGCDDCQSMSAKMGSGKSDDAHESLPLTHALQPTISRMNGILVEIIRRSNTPTTIDNSKIEERLTTIEQRAEGIAEVRSLLSEVKALAERIAAQPVSGGPRLNGAAVEKSFVGQNGDVSSPINDIAAIQRASQLGLLTDQDSQLRAAAQMIKLQNGTR